MQVHEMYRVLGISHNADVDQIRDAYRRLVKRHHPDMGGSSDRFTTVMEAYEGLMRMPAIALEIRSRRNARARHAGVHARGSRAHVREGRRGAAPSAERNGSDSSSAGRSERGGTRTADLFELGSRAMTAPDAADRALACRNLGQTKLHSALAFLKRALRDASDEVRAAAAEAVIRLSSRDSASVLCERYRSLGQPAQKSALRALISAKTRRRQLIGYRPMVVMSLESENRELRRLALRAYAMLNRAPERENDL